MSCLDVPIQTILGTECIGDSLPKINTNFSVLGDAACELYAKVNELSSVPAVDASVNTFDSPTIDLNWNASTRTLSAVTTAMVATSSSPMVAKAWVLFNGTLSTPILPKASYNISSITKNGTGDYTLNFTNSLNDSNYTFIGQVGATTGGVNGPDGREAFGPIYPNPGSTPTLKTASQVRCYSVSTGTVYNAYDISAVIFGN